MLKEIQFEHSTFQTPHIAKTEWALSSWVWSAYLKSVWLQMHRVFDRNSQAWFKYDTCFLTLNRTCKPVSNMTHSQCRWAIHRCADMLKRDKNNKQLSFNKNTLKIFGASFLPKPNLYIRKSSLPAVFEIGWAPPVERNLCNQVMPCTMLCFCCVYQFTLLWFNWFVDNSPKE